MAVNISNLHPSLKRFCPIPSRCVQEEGGGEELRTCRTQQACTGREGSKEVGQHLPSLKPQIQALRWAHLLDVDAPLREDFLKEIESLIRKCHPVLSSLRGFLLSLTRKDSKWLRKANTKSSEFEEEGDVLAKIQIPTMEVEPQATTTHCEEIEFSGGGRQPSGLKSKTSSWRSFRRS